MRGRSGSRAESDARELVTAAALRATFRRRLRALRKERCGTQKRASKELGLPRTYFSDYERGRSLPRVETLLHIADSWSVPLDWLLLPEGRRDLIDRGGDELLGWFVAVDELLVDAGRGARTSGAGQEHFGSRLRRRRIERGWTQAELARRIGVNRVVISRYELAHGVPHAVRLAKLAQALETSIEALVRSEPRWPQLHLAAAEASLYLRISEMPRGCRQVALDILMRIDERARGGKSVVASQ